MTRFIGPATILLMAAQVVAVSLVIWRVSRWRRWLLIRQLLLTILFVVLAVMLWNFGVVLWMPPPGR